MPLNGPIIIVEDDQEDQELLAEALQELGVSNRFRYFREGEAVLEYLRTTGEKPFLIITDVALPGMNGIDLRTAIISDGYLRQKSIPFVFLSTSDNKAAIHKIYELQVQGYFQKADTFDGIKRQVKLLIDYWKECIHPNSD